LIANEIFLYSSLSDRIKAMLWRVRVKGEYIM
jgi:hypothetical protein